MKVLSEPHAIPSKFPMGQLVFTNGVADKVTEDPAFDEFVITSLLRHGRCDWGDMCENDIRENEFSLDKHLRLFSAYKHETLPKIWVITEADRSATTVLFPEEY